MLLERPCTDSEDAGGIYMADMHYNAGAAVYGQENAPGSNAGCGVSGCAVYTATGMRTTGGLCTQRGGRKLRKKYSSYLRFPYNGCFQVRLRSRRI